MCFPVIEDRYGQFPDPFPYLSALNANVMSVSAAATCIHEETSMTATADWVGWSVQVADRAVVYEGDTGQPSLPHTVLCEKQALVAKMATCSSLSPSFWTHSWIHYPWDWGRAHGLQAVTCTTPRPGAGPPPTPRCPSSLSLPWLVAYILWPQGGEGAEH